MKEGDREVMMTLPGVETETHPFTTMDPIIDANHKVRVILEL